MKKNIYQKKLMTVTTFSKILAALLFFLLIFASFLLGMKYKEKEYTILNQVNILSE